MYTHFGSTWKYLHYFPNFHIGLTLFSLSIIDVELRWKQYLTVSFLGFFFEVRFRDS